MDFAYGIGGTTLFGKVVRMGNSKIRTQVSTIAIKRAPGTSIFRMKWLH
jgi:hypothetical protein